MKSICSIESDSIRVQFEDRDGLPWVQLLDLASQTTWGPTPAVGIEMYDVACQRVDAIAPSRVTTARHADAVELEVAHEWYGVKFVVRFEASIEAMKLDYELMLRKLRSTCLEALMDYELIEGDPREGITSPARATAMGRRCSAISAGCGWRSTASRIRCHSISARTPRSRSGSGHR